MPQQDLLPSFRSATFVDALRSDSRVSGHTHGFYTYPARFSPKFVESVITEFTQPGDLVVDPFMGGGTVLVESKANGRFSVGTDISELSTFVTRVKTRVLPRTTTEKIRSSIPRLRRGLVSNREPTTPSPSMRNLESQVKLIRQIRLALDWATSQPSAQAEEFARCAILRAGQLCINGRKEAASPCKFNDTLFRIVETMVLEADKYRHTARIAFSDQPSHSISKALPRNARAEYIPDILERAGRTAPKLVLTSPPYPGIHMLYHRWQLNGGKETDLPFFIANKKDGEGLAFYCMSARKRDNLETYLQLLSSTYSAIRRCLDESTIMVQLVAFSNPRSQLPRYLKVMENSGYVEIRGARNKRQVPNRKWYTTVNKSQSSSSQEYMLVHKIK